MHNRNRIRAYVLGAVAAPMIFLAAQSGTSASAQAAPAAQNAAQAHRQAQQQLQAAPVPISDEEFKATQEQLLQLLRTSPTLTTVVAHDPSLLSDQDYVSRNNPLFAQFLLQHPDVARNPEYYLFTHIDQHGKFRRDQALERAVWPDMVPGDRSPSDPWGFAHALIPIIIVPAFLLALVWIVKLIVESLRWNRAFRQQGEIHSRLIDKLGTSQDLAAYMETEAGKRFLAGAPIAFGPNMNHQVPNAVARVLTPLQIGVVMVLLGIGFLLLRNAGPDTSTPMLILGTLILMPGIGFILSAGITWILAGRLGLMPGPTGDIEVHPQGRQ